MQVLWSEELNYRALDQWTRELPIIAQRGKITDRNGVVLADNVTVCNVSVIHNQIKEREKVIEVLCKELDLTQEYV